MENIEKLKNEIVSWAAEQGQEHVAIEITRAWFQLGADGDRVRLYQIEDETGAADWRAINTNRQAIFRHMRSESKAAREKVQELADAMLAALPAERRARLAGPTQQYLLSVAIREFAAAIIAILLGACDTPQRIAGALVALQETQRLTSAA
ncbi:toxin YdaT family protein [Serratia marcescens]|uniref:toxin YdaT family protein n=1 Tax=Serratia TaxID=613 RepID=UPI0029DAC9CB|nr:toxin YdaT family protein [Serratia marcescens]MDX7272610.1 toxin YdaT family protein [Serratia marcescens]